MVGLGVLLVLVGAVMFLVDRIDKDGHAPYRLIGVSLAVVGLASVLSSFYLRYTPWFYVFALAKGALLVTLSWYLKNEKLKLPGIGLLVAGFLMIIVKPGWFLALLLAGVAALAYYLYSNDKRTKVMVDAFVKQKS